jgi:hypothetical protein
MLSRGKDGFTAWMCVIVDIGRALTKPSGPGEFHPRPLTDPDVTVSGHPARATPRRPAGRPRTPTGSSRCRLARRRRAGDPPPSLPGSYPSSSLLRGGPPLTGASVLSASRVRRLGLFPWHHRQGSHVLPGSPGWSHVPFTPDATWPVNRLPPGCSQGIPSTLVSASSLSFRRVVGDSLTLISPAPT